MRNLPANLRCRWGRLANLGVGHWALDGGAGYTYFDPQSEHEFSAVAGLTYNFVNPSTDYRNGLDFHLDWGASQFLSEQLHGWRGRLFLPSDHGRQWCGGPRRRF